MALFDGAAGDIWSTGAFSFESPMKDLLDGGEYTLEQLLREDELLQEVKSMQPQLIDFLAQSSSISALVDFLVRPYNDGDEEEDDDDGDVGDAENATNAHSSGNKGSADDDEDGDDDGIEYQTVAVEAEGVEVVTVVEDTATIGEDGLVIAASKSSSGNKSESAIIADVVGQQQQSQETVQTQASEQGHNYECSSPTLESGDERKSLKDGKCADTATCNSHEGAKMALEAEEGLDVHDVIAMHRIREKSKEDAEMLRQTANDVAGNDDTLSSGEETETDVIEEAQNVAVMEKEATDSNNGDSNYSSLLSFSSQPEEKDDNDAGGGTLQASPSFDIPGSTKGEVGEYGFSDLKNSEDTNKNDGDDGGDKYQQCNDDDNTTDDDEEDRALRRIRYPYMACEIVCCENTRIVDLLVDGKDEHGVLFLERLFSILDYEPGNIDDRRAGYFEKILSVLFRMRSASLSEFINDRTVQLLPKFVNHLGSFSIMQVLQRLLLPERPGQGVAAVENDYQSELERQDDMPSNEDEDEALLALGYLRCHWGSDVQTASLLVNRLLNSDLSTFEVASHASELLVSLVQQAPLDSPLLKMLSSCPVLNNIVDKATVLPDGEESFSPHESPMTSAMNLLESIVLQLGGFGCVPPVNESLSISFHTNTAGAVSESLASTSSNVTKDTCADEVEAGGRDGGEDLDANAEKHYLQGDDHNTPLQAASIERDTSPCGGDVMTPTEGCYQSLAKSSIERWKNLAQSDDLKALLPTALPALQTFLLDDPVKRNHWRLRNQLGEDAPQLGASRLKIVRLIEAMVLLAHPGVDEELIRSRILMNCLDLFFCFQWCSMLHQSVANLVVHVLESGTRRASLQAHLIDDLSLLERLLDGYGVNEEKERARESTPDGGGDYGGDGQGQVQGRETLFRSGYMGHLIIICQAIVQACNEPEEEQNPSTFSTEAVVSSSSATTSISEDNSADDHAQGGGDVVSSSKDDGGGTTQSGKNVSGSAATSIPTLSVLVSQNFASKRWEHFVSTSLAEVTTVQSTPLGGINPPPRGHDCLLGPAPSHTGSENNVTNGGGSDMLDMNDNDLDVAVSMLENLTMSRSSDMMHSSDEVMMNGGMEMMDMEDKPVRNGGHTRDSSEHHIGHIAMCSHIDQSSGKGVGGEYFYDDPLGGRDNLSRKLGIHDDDEDEEEEENEKYSNPLRSEEGNDDVHHGRYEDEGGGDAEHDVPVMDLFTGNFDVECMEDEAKDRKSSTSAASSEADVPWANFDDFDSASESKGRGSNNEAATNDTAAPPAPPADEFSLEDNWADFTFSDGTCITRSPPLKEDDDDSEDDAMFGAGERDVQLFESDVHPPRNGSKANDDNHDSSMKGMIIQEQRQKGKAKEKCWV